MRLRSIIGIIICLLLLTLVTAPANAAVSIHLSKTSGRSGDILTVQGTADPDSWISLRMINAEGAVVYFAAVQSNQQGKYTDTFLVPDIPSGQVQIIAGQGSDGSIAVFKVKRDVSSSSDGSRDSGGSSSISDPAKPESNEESTQPEPETQPENQIPNDIAGHWARESIMKLVKTGVVSGYPDGSFRPEEKITRGEFATLLVKALQLPNAKNGKVFSDTRDHWARENIAAAVGAGIAAGYPDNTFKPDAPINREELAAMAAHAARLTAASGETSFADNQEISAWAKGLVLAAANARIVNGGPDRTFRPKDNATRAEAVCVILALMK